MNDQELCSNYCKLLGFSIFEFLIKMEKFKVVRKICQALKITTCLKSKGFGACENSCFQGTV